MNIILIVAILIVIIAAMWATRPITHEELIARELDRLEGVGPYKSTLFDEEQ